MSSNSSSLPSVTIYTDGACRGNPGPGGWAAILINEDALKPEARKTKKIFGGFRMTTNNRMELMAAIQALEALKRSCQVALHSDSKYVVDAFNKKWVVGWQKRGWINSQKEPVKNRDLWERLIAATEQHKVSFAYVAGHADSALNNECDELAVAASCGSELDVDFGFETKR